ncbi:MAG: NAD(P)-dependent dehydrogenase (short-subunit alcohol dehydrogenase family) [Flavobacterium sp.]|jgi:NAD(P)-dependent dehydrogenase (short-subunit alcohol dehydrogenase family)
MIPWFEAKKCAVITGGGNGIGLAVAKRFLEKGMRVLLADISEDALVRARIQLNGAGGELITHVCDVSDIEQVNNLKSVALDTFGNVDCLMNNAGASITRAAPWEDVDGWKKQIDINLWGIIHGCHAFIPSMLESTTPVAVINTGSKQGITNPPGGAAYNMSKAGVINYTQSLAHALRQIKDCPISAHLMVPGFTYSNMIARFIEEKPDGAWTCDQVADYLLNSLKSGDFYIICPDNDTPRSLDDKRMQWNLDDIVKNRPALSRWHPDFADKYEAFVDD